MDGKYLLSNALKFNIDQAESVLKSGDYDAVFKLMEQSKKDDVFEHFFGYSYAKRTSNLLQFVTRHTEFVILKALFEYLKQLLGVAYFNQCTKQYKDAYGKDILAIAAKYRCDDVIWYLIQNCSLDYNNYPKDGKGALYYLLIRKKEDLSHSLISLMDSKNYFGVQHEHFYKDMLLLKENISLIALASQRWINILTDEFYKKGRVSKMHQPISRYSSNFSRSRRKQLLRHVAFQLFCRWKYHLGISFLKDVQVMCVTPLSNKDNPYPKPTLFIALSPTTAAHSVRDDFKKKMPLKEMLTVSYQGSISESVKRSHRFAKKLSDRVWGSELRKSTRDSRLIQELLKIDHRNTININNQDGKVKFAFFRMSENELILLIPGQEFEDIYFHAEDTLCNVATALQANAELNICIFGKNRPCVSCYAQMKSTKINSFNFRYGFLYEHIHYQKNMETRKETAYSLFHKASFVTQTKKNSTDKKHFCNYDTASDSD